MLFRSVDEGDQREVQPERLEPLAGDVNRRVQRARFADFDGDLRERLKQRGVVGLARQGTKVSGPRSKRKVQVGTFGGSLGVVSVLT